MKARGAAGAGRGRGRAPARRPADPLSSSPPDAGRDAKVVRGASRSPRAPPKTPQSKPPLCLPPHFNRRAARVFWHKMAAVNRPGPPTPLQLMGNMGTLAQYVRPASPRSSISTSASAHCAYSGTKWLPSVTQSQPLAQTPRAVILCHNRP